MRRLLRISIAVFLAEACWAQNIDIRVPTSVAAGDEATISTAGSGKATFYLVGPGVSLKN